MKISPEKVKEILDKNKGDIQATAKELNVAVSNVYRRIKQYNDNQAKANKPVKAIEPSGEVKTEPEKTEPTAEPVKVEAVITGNTITKEIEGDEIFKPETFLVNKSDKDLKGYIKRQPYWNMFNDSLDNGEAVFLVGESGCGKTSMVRKYASEKNLPFLHISCDNIMEFGELVGYHGLRNGNTFFREGALIKLACNMPSILLLDEATFMDSGKFGRLQVFIENRKFFVKEANDGQGCYYELHPDTKIVLAGNPPSAVYVGANKVNYALLRRVRIIEMPGFTPSELKKLFDTEPLHAEIIQFYTEVKRIIEMQNFKICFSLTDVKKIFTAIKQGWKICDAIETGYLNGIKLMGNRDVAKSFADLSVTILGNKTNKVYADIVAEMEKEKKDKGAK